MRKVLPAKYRCSRSLSEVCAYVWEGKVTSTKKPEGYRCSTSTAMKWSLEDFLVLHLKFI